MLQRVLKIFRPTRKTSLGIDIGTSSVKVVEIAGGPKTPELLSYGELQTYGYLRRLREPLQSASVSLLDGDIAGMIRQILDAAGVTTRHASLSIPLFSAFSATIELPVMTQEELQEAVPYQAQQIVPVPLSEVILDWEVIGRYGKVEAQGVAPRQRLLVLLVAVPREVVDHAVRIAKLAQIELDGLEVETFSLVRSSLRDEKRPTALIDIGARSTNLVIAEEGTVRVSRSIDTSGSELTTAISRSLGIELGRAEAMKIEDGIEEDTPANIRGILLTIIDGILTEAEKLMTTYVRHYGKQVERVVLAGGTATLPGLAGYANERLRVPVSLAKPFEGFRCPDELRPVLEEIGPSFAVAVGLALRNVVGAQG
jgi:type IV pilus assembly protein PilM